MTEHDAGGAGEGGQAPDGADALDAVEYLRWIDAAEEHLRGARLLVAAGRHPGGVLLAEQSAQCSLKALLHAVGAETVARGHDLVALARSTREEAGLPLPSERLEALRRLSATYLSSRYPDALPGGLLGDHFGSEASAAAIAAAAEVLDAVRAVWRRLTEPNPGEPPSGGA